MAINFLNNPALTYTLDQFIAMRYIDEATYRNFSILQVVDGLELVDHNLIDDYMDELEQISVECELTLEQYKKYKYSPDIMAYDVYGSTQLDFVIMKLNGMIDPKDFNLKKVLLPYKSKLIAFLNTVYNSNLNYINQNRADNGLKTFI